MEAKDVILILLYVVLTALLWYYGSYIKKRGENLATQKDIKKITRDIENVKQEIEDISFKKQDKFIQFKDSLLDFNKEYVLYIEYYIKNIFPVNSLSPDANAIRNNFGELIQQYSKVYHLFLKISIFSEDEDDEWVRRLYIEMMRSKPLYNITFHLLEQSTIIADNIARFERNKIDCSMLHKDLNEIIDKFIEERNGVQGEAIDSVNKIAALIKDKLNLKYT